MAKVSMLLMAAMKRVSLKQTPAPTPRLTRWVPSLGALALCLIWLGLLAMFQR